MNLVNRLLRKNLSTAQLAGFTLSNFIGLAIIVTGLQFYLDVRPLWEDEDSFIKKDYLVINKRVTNANTLGDTDNAFTPTEIADLRNQAWVRDVGAFQAVNYKVSALVEQGGRGMSTSMFFESLPDKFVDASSAAWRYTPGDRDVPIILSKDYLALYNFGFAGSAGMPQMSESGMGSLPVTLRLQSENGDRTEYFTGRIVGFSNRLNTILVPQSFMDWSNATFGKGGGKAPSRLIVDVSSPGDTAITKYLYDHDLEVAGDKSNSQASFLLNIIAGVVIAIGIVITLLSFFILMLSISLLMQKNRDKLHLLLMLGYQPRTVARPYITLIVGVSAISLVLAIAAMLCVRMAYISGLQGLTESSGGIITSVGTGIALTCITIVFNAASVWRKVVGAFGRDC